MGFDSFWYPPSTPVFPKASQVQKYSESYAEHFKLKPYIRLNTRVDSIRRTDESSIDTSTTSTPKKRKWKVKLSTGEAEFFDFVIIANGHYHKPLYPSVPGIDQWLDAGNAMHSVWYRNPQSLPIPRDRKIRKLLVVGGSASGTDISRELALHGVADVILHSVTGGGEAPQFSNGIQTRGRLVELRDADTVVFDDGVIEKGVDFVILGTGYQLALPFFDDTSICENGIPPATVPPLPDDLWKSTHTVFPLASHIFPLTSTSPSSVDTSALTSSSLSPSPDLSLAFVGITVRAAVFRTVEAQARAVVHVFGNPHTFDLQKETDGVLSRWKELKHRLSSPEMSEEDERKRIIREWHRFVEGPEQFIYRDELYKFADASRYPSSGPGAVEGISGRVVVPEWEKKLLTQKNQTLMRKFWKELERRGEAERWVKGVGEAGGMEGRREWIRLLERLLEAAKAEEGLEVTEDDYRLTRL